MAIIVLLLAILGPLWIVRFLGVPWSLALGGLSFLTSTVLQVFHLKNAGMALDVFTVVLLLCAVAIGVAQLVFSYFPRAGLFINGAPPYCGVLMKPLRLLAALCFLALLASATAGSLMASLYVARILRQLILPA